MVKKKKFFCESSFYLFIIGSLVKTYKGNGGIFEVCWNSKGDKVAACYANHTICVINFP